MSHHGVSKAFTNSMVTPRTFSNIRSRVNPYSAEVLLYKQRERMVLFNLKSS